MPEHPALAILAMAASAGLASECVFDWLERNTQPRPPMKFTRTIALALHPVHGEWVGHRLMRELGIGTAPSLELITAAEARARGTQRWVYKIMRSSGFASLEDQAGGPRLKSVGQIPELPAQAEVVAVEKIPGAITLRSLELLHGFRVPAINARSRRPRAQTDGLIAMLREGRFECCSRSNFFGDFAPPRDRSALQGAIAPDSPEILAIHAARIFLGCSCGHASNVLVDVRGRLHSIDHESVMSWNEFMNQDIVFLISQCVKQGTPAFNAIERVAELREDQVAALFDDLPESKWAGPGGTPWYLGSRNQTEHYFLKRLRIWKDALRFSKRQHPWTATPSQDPPGAPQTLPGARNRLIPTISSDPISAQAHPAR